MIKFQPCICVWQFEGLMLLWQQGIVDLLSVIKVQLLSQWRVINSASGAAKGCKSNKPLFLIFISACWLQSWHPGAYYIIGHPSEMHLMLKFRVISVTIIYCSVVRSFWKFAQSTAVSLSCSMQALKQFENWNGCSRKMRFREIWV